jgi:hypothetical protein
MIRRRLPEIIRSCGPIVYASDRHAVTWDGSLTLNIWVQTFGDLYTCVDCRTLETVPADLSAARVAAEAFYTDGE